MNELALFAGAGGGILGGVLLGWRTVCAVEIDPYARRVLLARQNDGCLPAFPVYDDVRTFDGTEWRNRVDVVSGGFQCQDISCAGKGAGITGKKSGLWSEMARIIGEVRPRYAFVENSPMLVGRGLAVVLGDLAKMGYDARWGIVGAHHVALPHVRERIWVHAADSSRGGLQRSRPNNAEHQDWEGTRKQLERLLESEAQLALSAGKDKRMVDGVASRMGRLRCIGNGQVPAVAALAWTILSDQSQ